MPEFRKDPTVDRWVIIATERAKRPVHREASDTALCPFCAGNESLTPPEVLVFRDQSDPSLQLAPRDAVGRLIRDGGRSRL